MGLQTTPAYIGVSGFTHPVELDRNILEAISGNRTGAMRYNDFALTPSASAMSVDIAAGNAIIVGTQANTQGAYFAWNNTTDTVAWPAAPGSNSRIDSLVLQIVDTQYGSDPGSPRAEWRVVSGTVAASPVPLPDSALNPAGSVYKPGAWWRVSNFQVFAGNTNLAAATQTHLRRYARLSGKTLCNFADLPSDAQFGDEAVVLDQGFRWVTWDGSYWRSPDDTGSWTALPLASGYSDGNTLSSAGSPQYRVKGKTIEFRGTVRLTTNGVMTGNTNQLVATLAAGLRPARFELSLGVCQWGSSVNANVPLARREVATNGNITLNGAVSATWFDLSGIKYELA